jgi:hypothetical protein
MDNSWMNFALEIGFLAFLGILYYFYQKRKILRFEDTKTPMVMNYILQTCLSEKEEGLAQPGLDKMIEALDDYLNNQDTKPPLPQLISFSKTSECSEGLQAVITEAMKEIEK